jgi:hypothetical protein
MKMKKPSSLWDVIWRTRGLIAAAALLSLVACNDRSSPNNLDCEKMASGRIPWGYYPGYGCGPVPPARTLYP